MVANFSKMVDMCCCCFFWPFGMPYYRCGLFYVSNKFVHSIAVRRISTFNCTLYNKVSRIEYKMLPLLQIQLLLELLLMLLLPSPKPTKTYENTYSTMDREIVQFACLLLIRSCVHFYNYIKCWFCYWRSSWLLLLP